MLMKAFSMTTIFRKIDRHTLEAKTDDISLVNHSQSEDAKYPILTSIEL